MPYGYQSGEERAGPKYQREHGPGCSSQAQSRTAPQETPGTPVVRYRPATTLSLPARGPALETLHTKESTKETNSLTSHPLLWSTQPRRYSKISEKYTPYTTYDQPSRPGVPVSKLPASSLASHLRPIHDANTSTTTPPALSCLIPPPGPSLAPDTPCFSQQPPADGTQYIASENR